MARRLVQFWAGGRVKKKSADGCADGAYRKGGKVKVKVVHKAKGGMPGAVAGMKHRAAMANPMDGRLDTGVVGRKRKAAMPAMGASMGALGPLGPIR